MGSVTRPVEETYYEITDQRLANTSLLRLFNILEDVDGLTKFQNIFKSVTINSDSITDILIVETYEVEGDGEAWWDDISYDVYGTPYLWWIICVMNNITNPYEELEPGSNITILKKDYMYTLFNDIERISQL